MLFFLNAKGDAHMEKYHRNTHLRLLTWHNFQFRNKHKFMNKYISFH